MHCPNSKKSQFTHFEMLQKSFERRFRKKCSIATKMTHRGVQNAQIWLKYSLFPCKVWQVNGLGDQLLVSFDPPYQFFLQSSHSIHSHLVMRRLKIATFLMNYILLFSRVCGCPFENRTWGLIKNSNAHWNGSSNTHLGHSRNMFEISSTKHFQIAVLSLRKTKVSVHIMPKFNEKKNFDRRRKQRLKKETKQQPKIRTGQLMKRCVRPN